MTTWNIDAAHTTVEFSVRHMGLSTVRGRFERFSGHVTTTADGTPSAVEVSIEAASISTNSADRDNHLRSADFFDAEQHPELTFRSTAVSALGGGRYRVEGELSMHGVVKSVALEAEVSEAMTDPWGMQRRAATVGGTINRKDFGLTWNQILEAGSLLVSEEVKLHFDVQVVAAS